MFFKEVGSLSFSSGSSESVRGSARDFLVVWTNRGDRLRTCKGSISGGGVGPLDWDKKSLSPSSSVVCGKAQLRARERKEGKGVYST